MNKIENIILHCSDSEFGTAIDIDGWHRQRGWNKIGYLGVILNGYTRPGIYWSHSDGAWEWGRVLNKDNLIDPSEIEAQAYGWNYKSVGICLVGTTLFSDPQFFMAKNMINNFRVLWNLSTKDVLGHYEIDTHGKTCPNIPMQIFRKFLEDDSEIDFLNTK